MELKQIKELMASMEKAGIKKLHIKEKDGSELGLEMQDSAPAVMHPHAPPTYHYPHPEAHPRFPSHPVIADAEKPAKSEHVEGKYVTSPMVGTYYSAPSPDDPLFVKVGDKVEENTVVCIIEAMKVMNEVKAGVKGTVAEICIQNGHPVEFGTKILRIT